MVFNFEYGKAIIQLSDHKHSSSIQSPWYVQIYNTWDNKLGLGFINKSN